MATSGKEGFGFERGWIARGLKAIEVDPQIFSPERREAAQLELAIGNRKVMALEAWLREMRLVWKEKGRVGLTPLGALIRQHDPTIEEWGTWGVIHYQLACDPKNSEVWYWYTNEFALEPFTRKDLEERLSASRGGVALRTIQNAIDSLLDALRRTPLGEEFGLLVGSGDGRYRRQETPRKRLHAAIGAYAIVDWATRHQRSTVHIEELLREPGAPGPIYRLSASILHQYLNEIADRYLRRVLQVSRTAGLNSVAITEKIDPLSLLKAYYLEEREGLSPLEALEQAGQTG